MGTPTVIRVGRVKNKVGIVTTVSTPRLFTAHFHVYAVYKSGRTMLLRSYGQWNGESGATAAFDAWVKQQGGLVNLG